MKSDDESVQKMSPDFETATELNIFAGRRICLQQFKSQEKKYAIIYLIDELRHIEPFKLAI